MRNDIEPWRCACRVLLAVLCAACGGGSPAEPAARARVLEALSPTMLEGTVGTAVADAPVVRATDGRGTPLAGVVVRFHGGVGSVDVAEAVTDARGIASPGRWVLGTRAGEQRLTASSGGVVVSFDAIARSGAPVILVPLIATDLAAFSGDAVYVTVAVRDRFENGVGDVDVVLEVAGGDGEVGGAIRSVRRTNHDGVVQAVEWALGARPGTNVLAARVADVAPVIFTALTVDLATVTWYELRARRDDMAEVPVQPTPGQTPVRIALTPIDACLCREQTGHFVQRGWTFGAGPPVDRSGTFRIDGTGTGASLSLTWTSDYVPVGETPLSAPALLKGDSLLVELSDPDSGYSELWIYVRSTAP